MFALMSLLVYKLAESAYARPTMWPNEISTSEFQLVAFTIQASIQFRISKLAKSQGSIQFLPLVLVALIN